jgi:DNA-binding beta-propeller fold protein YncE
VAISDDTGVTLISNFGSNTISELNLSLLKAATPATTLTATSIGGLQQPIAIAIDPDRGTNNQGLGVVTSLQLISGSAPFGALQAVDIGLASPSLSTTASTGTVNSTPTGLVFNPVTDLFYANASGANTISSYNPDTGATSTATVGINPTGLALNPQTGAMLTSNVVGKSISIVDITSNPLKTRQTIGIPGSPQFGVAIDQFTNLAVIVDQANNRLLIFPMP